MDRQYSANRLTVQLKMDLENLQLLSVMTNVLVFEALFFGEKKKKLFQIFDEFFSSKLVEKSFLLKC